MRPVTGYAAPHHHGPSCLDNSINYQYRRKETLMAKKKKTTSGINLRPLGDRVWIEPIEEAEVTQSGLYLPETAKERPQRGRILAVGPGERDKQGEYIPMDVKVGDIVLFAKYAGTEVKLGTEKYKLLRQSDILAIIEE